jgi:hypothetical protein
MIEDLGHPATSYNWGPMRSDLTGFSDRGPNTRPQMRLTGAGRVHRVKQRDFTGNPLGFVEYQGRLIPYVNISTGNRGAPVEHAMMEDLRGHVAQGGQLLAPEDLMSGPDDSYLVGSGVQFRQANASPMSTVFHHRSQAGRPLSLGGPQPVPELQSNVRRPRGR